jgi:hypothetical protein
MKFVLHFRSYIAHPYWPERESVVNILKASGYNRVRSEDKRESTLMRYLEKLGMTMDQYQAMVVKANEQWYRLGNNGTGKIIVPRHHFSGALVQACKSAPAGARFNEDQLRSLLDIRDFITDKTERDRVFSRFVLPKDGKGNALSNQRTLRENDVIEDFDATGEINFDENDVKLDAVLSLLDYTGKYVGCGASRKMGYGRFTVLEPKRPDKKPAKAKAKAAASEDEDE